MKTKIIKTLLIASLVLVGAAGTRALGREPAPAADQSAQRTDANSQLAHAQLIEKARKGRIDVYFVGDSITQRWGATDYPKYLAHWKQNFFGWNAANFGWGADAIQNILWRLENGEMDGVGPKIIVILAGTNNIGAAPARGDDDPRIANATRGIKAILETCRKKAPEAKIVLTAIFPRNDNMGVMPVINKVNENISRFADAQKPDRQGGPQIRFLNVNGKLADKDGKLYEGMMNADKLHPDLKGYQVWADGLKPIFTEILGPPAKEDLTPPPTGDPSQVAGKNANHKAPRVIITSDFPPVDVIPIGAGSGPADKRSDPDDVQSMVRFLLYTNYLDVEGLMASAGTLANIARKQNILDMLNLYDQVDENLRKHDPRYPTADQLRSVTWQGRDNAWGKPAKEILGEGKDSEASDAIIRVVDQPDPRPVWVCVWGGPREVAQAIWKVQRTRSPVELERFLSKLRIYLIAKQDGSAQWLLDNFSNLFVIVADRTYFGMFWDAHGADPKLADLTWINANIRQGHGPLGAVYPESGFNPAKPGQQEGDTPSFLYLVSAALGLNDLEKPDQESWGGQFVRKDASKNHWFDGPGAQSVSKWRAEVQEDFARRADWMLP